MKIFILIALNIINILNCQSSQLPFCVSQCNCSETTIRCLNASLERVPFVAAETTVLDLRFNNIDNLNQYAFRHLSRVTTLSLSNNRIVNLDDHVFAGLGQLKYLYLSNNKIKSIGNKSLKNLHNLQYLYLNHNEIRDISAKVFTDLPALEQIFLQHNHFKNFNKDLIINNKKLQTIRLDENPLICDCQIIWFKIYNLSSFEGSCASPPEFEGKNVINLSSNELKCTEHTIARQIQDSPIVKTEQIIKQENSREKNISFKSKRLIKAIGSNLLLDCPKSTKPKWSLNGTDIVSSDRFGILSNGSLFIRNILKMDGGIFKCYENELSTIEGYKLIISEPPVFTEVPESIVEIESGNKLMLKCEASGFPKPTIEWTRKNFRDFKIVDEILILENAKPSDEGVYECFARNNLGIAAKEVKVKVRGGELPLDFHTNQSSETSDLFAAVQEARLTVDQAIESTLESIKSKSYKSQSPGKLMQIARFPLLPESIEFAKSIEIYEKALEIIRRKAEAKVKLPMTEYKYEDLLSPNQLNILAHLSGCLIGHRMHNTQIVSDCKEDCNHEVFRSYDGICNNKENMLWGASLTPFQRLLPPIYEDGINLPVGWFPDRIYSGFAKPNARKVCRNILTTRSVTSDSRHSHMLMQFGQFLDHDMDFSMPSVSFNTFDRESLDCSRTCDKRHPCFSIEIPKDDPRRNLTRKRHSFRLHTEQNCIELIRSSASCGSGFTSVAIGKLMHREQVNQLTSFIDGSNIYGSISSLANNLRDKHPRDMGLMRSTTIETKQYLPLNDVRLPNDCQQDPRHSDFGCFLAGDIRANEQLGLLAMHTLWLREHNRIASMMSKLNPDWSGERVYQETRKIVGAQLQVITYKHWLPHILGHQGMKKLGVYKGYDKKVNPSIANVFATAALRFGHTLINPFLTRLNETYNPTTNYSSNLILHKTFFAPHRLVEEGGIDPLLRGLLFSPTKSPRSDQIINNELTEHLFELARDISLDLGSINIQRGRDHGLPGYNDWRKYCNLTVAQTFNDLRREIKNNKLRVKLKESYGHPDNVDLWVGAVAEDVLPGSKVGPTFRCLLAEQFKRVRDGDRFYYENPAIFSSEQLQEIKKSSLARVICDNSDNISNITEDVFLQPKHQVWKKCNELPAIDLNKWQSNFSQTKQCNDENEVEFNIPIELLNKLKKG